jgi:4-amino-4-deoxy-L-arabinose transferase-like glycosyltransferase
MTPVSTEPEAPQKTDNRALWRARLFSASALFLLPLLYFFPAVIGKITLAPGDGWAQNFGPRVLIGQMIAAGQIPLWNPFIFAGTPLLASIYPGALYPPNWVFAFLEPRLAMNVLVISTYHLGLIGTYLYARRIGITRVGALVAGMTFTFGAFMVSHLGHTSRIAAAVWLPWILLALEALYHQFRWRWIALGAIFIALQLFAGEPQMNLYTVMVAGSYGAYSLLLREARETRLRFLTACSLMALCGVLFSLPQLLPERELLQFSERARIDYEYFSQFSLPPRQFWSFFFPYFFGGASSDPYKVAYWGEWNPTEVAAYAGLLPWLLAMAAIWRAKPRGLVWFWACWAGLALLLSFGSYIPFGLNHLLHHVPVYNLFRAPGRNLYEFNFALGILAGFGLTALVQLEANVRRRILAWACAALGVVMLAGVVVYRFFLPKLVKDVPLPLQAGQLTNPDVWVPLVFFTLSVVTLWCFLRWRTTGAAALLVSVLLLDTLSFGFYYEWRLPDFDVAQVLSDAPTVKLIKEREPDLNSFRIISQSSFPFGKNTNLLNYPNVSIVRGLQSVNGYDALRLVRTTELAGNMTLDGWVEDLNAFNAEHQGFNLLNTKYLLTERATASGPEDSITHAGIRFSSEPINLRLEAGWRKGINTRVTGTELALVSNLGDAVDMPDGTVVVEVTLFTADGRVIRHELRAGRDTAEWAYDRDDVKPKIQHQRPTVAESWPVGGFAGHRYLARIPFERAEITHIEFKYALNHAVFEITRASLYDAQTQTSTPLDAVILPAERWREIGSSGPVKIYENLKALPRAWFVRRLQMSTTSEVKQAIRTGKFADGTPFDPHEVALFEKELYGKEQLDFSAPGDPAGAEVKIARYEPQRLELETRNAQPGFLVLSEIYYRGWDAFIDGRRVPVERVNYALRGLNVPAGTHRVEFVFRSPSFKQGARLAALGALLLLLGALGGRLGINHKLEKRFLALNLSRRLLATSRGWLLLALLTGYFVFLAQHTAYAVGGSDSSGYANLARSFLRGPIPQPVNELAQFGVSAENADVFCPLAYLTARRPNAPVIQTPLYPPGFPLHLVLGVILAGWNWGPYLVNPLLAVLSLPLIFLIGIELGLPRAWAGAGVALLAINPTFLIMTLQPMSDVAALFWGMVAVWAGLRARRVENWAYLAGAAFGVAVLVRPTNILLLPPLLFCLPWRWPVWRRFGVGGLPPGAIFCAYNLAVFEHPLRTGYGTMGLQHYLMFTRLGTRARYYFNHLSLTMTVLPLLGWLGVVAARRIAWRDRAVVLAWFGTFMLFYVFYDVYEGWGETRFILPGYPGLLLGALLAAYALLEQGRETTRWRWAVGVPLLVLTLGYTGYFVYRNRVWGMKESLAFNAESCRWADAQVPPQTLLVSMEMSGALKFYTRRSVFRWDQVRPDAWPELYRQVLARGFQFYALLMDYEVERAQATVAGRWEELGHVAHVGLWRIEPLDKAPPRVEFASGFHGWERLGDRKWQWMSGDAVVRLQNTGQPMQLRIAGAVPATAFTRPTSFKLFLNGTLLEQFAALEQPVQREYTLTAAQQGSGEWSELRLQADQTITPRQADPSNLDERQLSFSLTELVWEESAPPPQNTTSKNKRQE